MLTSIQWYSLTGSVLFLLLVLDAVRRQRLREAYALIWLMISVGMLVMSLWTDILKLISELIGIQYPPATLFLLLTVGILLLLFQYSIVISLHNEKIIRLAQEIALLKEQLRHAARNPVIRRRSGGFIRRDGVARRGQLSDSPNTFPGTAET